MELLEIDQSYEEEILNLLLSKVPEFQGLTVRHLTATATYDFCAFKNEEQVAELDVKVRDEASDAYEDYFVSKEKVNRMRKNPPIKFYIIYYFKADKRIRVYDLRKCNLKDKEIEFTHKRSGKRVKSLVFCIPRGQWIFDAYLAGDF